MASNLHYRLTTTELLAIISDLTPSQKDVLLFLRTINPFGDRALDFNASDIARELGVHRSTVSRALKALVEKGYIIATPIKATFKILTKATLLQENNSECNSESTDASEQPLMQDNNIQLTEPLPDEVSSKPQTNQTIQSNSKEREKIDGMKYENRPSQCLSMSQVEWYDFIEWLRLKGNQLPIKPSLINRWIASQLREPVNLTQFFGIKPTLQKKPVCSESFELPKIFDEALQLGVSIHWLKQLESEWNFFPANQKIILEALERKCKELNEF
jgi:DNA-binding MarR family transcriptional regulator